VGGATLRAYVARFSVLLIRFWLPNVGNGLPNITKRSPNE